VSDLRHAPTIFKRYSTVCFVDRLFTLRANLITFHVVLYVALCASHLHGYDPTENTPSPLHNMFARPHSEQSQRLSHQDRTEMGAMENLNSLVCSVVTPTGHSVNSCSKQFAVLFHCPAVLVTCLAIDRHGTAFGLATEPGSWWQLIRAKYWQSELSVSALSGWGEWTAAGNLRRIVTEKWCDNREDNVYDDFGDDDDKRNCDNV